MPRLTVKPENSNYLQSLAQAWGIEKEGDCLNYLLHELRRQGYGLTPLPQSDYVSIPKSEMYQPQLQETVDTDPVLDRLINLGLICDF